MIENSDIEYKIDNYLRNRLSAEDQESFEREMAADPDLTAAVEAQKLVLGAVSYFRKEELKNYIRDNIAEENKKRGIGPFWMSIAAATVLAFGAGYYVYFKQQGAGNKKTDDLAYQSPNAKSNRESKSDAKSDSVKNSPPDQLSKPSAKAEPDVQVPASENKTLADHSKAEQAGPNKQEYADLKPLNDSSKAATGLEKQKITADVNPEIFNNTYTSQGSASGGNSAATYQWRSGDSYTVDKKTELKTKESSSRKSKARKNARDSIKSDELLAEKKINIHIISAAPEEKPMSRSLMAKNNIPVSFWKSSVNFKGYHYYKNKLSLYGLEPDADINILKLNDILYLNIKGDIFQLVKGDYYTDFSKPIKDQQLLKSLGN